MILIVALELHCRCITPKIMDTENGKLSTIFIDYSRTFDTVDRGKLFIAAVVTTGADRRPLELAGR